MQCQRWCFVELGSAGPDELNSIPLVFEQQQCFFIGVVENKLSGGKPLPNCIGITSLSDSGLITMMMMMMMMNT